MTIASGSYIAIEGPIGVGKTSLARILAERMEMRLILEGAESNPFLPDFYKDPRRFALQTQLNFLLSRHRQQSEIKQLSLFHSAVAADYIYEKDSIFAHLTLDDRDLDLYTKIASLLDTDIPVPDMVVYLQSSSERLLTNIKVRGVGYEGGITRDYLEKLCEAYTRFFFNWERSAVLVVNTTKIDFVNNEDDCNRLIGIIADMPAGITYFNPEA